MKKKIVAFVWNSFNNDGRVFRECSALVEAGFNIELICLSENNIGYMTNVEGIEVTKIGKIKNKAVNAIVNIIRMTRLGISRRAEYYHSNDLSGLLQGALSKLVLLILYRKRSKLIYDSHELQKYRNGISKHFHFLEKMIIPFCDEIIVTNQYRKEIFCNLYPSRSIKVLFNYPVMSQLINESINFYDMFNIDSTKRIILYQGGFQIDRGIECMIDAMEYIDDAVLLLIGDGPIKTQLKARIEKKSYNAKTYIIDMIPYKQLKYYTRGAHIGLQLLEDTGLNHKTALSNKIFEYMDAEIPIIATDIREIKLIIDKEKNGVVIEELSPIVLSKAINRIFSDDELYNRFVNNAKRAKWNYDWCVEKEKYIEIFNTGEKFNV